MDNSQGLPVIRQRMGGVTMTAEPDDRLASFADPLVRPELGTAWTIEDLWRLPDDGFRYEIIDGSLLVSPPPAIPHLRVTTRLRNLLHAQAPDDLIVAENGGVSMAKGRTYRIPDLVVVRASAIEGDATAFLPADVVLAVEVLSPDSGDDDLVMKRYQYGRAGIPHYWIVDRRKRTLTVLRHDGARATCTSRPSTRVRCGAATSRSRSSSTRPASSEPPSCLHARAHDGP